MAVELSRVIGGAPQLITIGADKTLAIWDTISFKVLYFVKGLHMTALSTISLLFLTYLFDIRRSCGELSLFQNWLVKVWPLGATLELQTLIY